jgi:hypothetical protein
MMTTQREAREELRARADALAVEKIPEGHVRVRRRADGKFVTDDGERLSDRAPIQFHAFLEGWLPVGEAGRERIVEPVASISLADLEREHGAQRAAAALAADKGRQHAERRRAAFEQARATGQPVELRRWVEPSDRPDSTHDEVREYAQPDGTLRRVRAPLH